MDLSSYFKRNAPVTAPLVGFPGVHLNKTTIKENLFDSKAQISTITSINDKFNPDILFTFMDLTVEAHALGIPVKYTDMESPSVTEHILKNQEDLARIPGLFSSSNERVKVFIDTVEGVKRDIPDKPLAAYVSGPFTLAGLLMGANEIALNTILNKKFVEETVRIAADIIKEYSKALIAAGADMIVILEPTAGMLSTDMYREFSGTWTAEIVSDIETCSILHICGNTEHLIDEMCKTKVKGLSLDAAVDLAKIAPKVPSDVYIIGNIDPVSVMCEKDQNEIKEKTIELKKAMSNFSNFIVSTGCDLPPETPLKNISAFVQAGKLPV